MKIDYTIFKAFSFFKLVKDKHKEYVARNRTLFNCE